MNLLDYIKGNRKGKNARKIELEAMADPFLTDAIEGFDTVKGDHVQNISQLQTRITALSSHARKKKQTIGLRITAAAIALIALLSGYFILMNHRSTMLSAHETEMAYINIYAPEEYIDRKRAELAEIDEIYPVNINTLVEIENLHEVIKPFAPMLVYVPENKTEKPNDSDLRTPVSKIANHDLYAVASEATNNMQDDAEIDAVQKDQSNILSDANISASSRNKNLASKQISDNKKMISGKVVDENGEPIIGASIKLKNSNTGTMTDMNGNYSLQVDANSPEISASYIGFETVDIPNAQSHQDIAMKESRLALNEVVVLGYGTQRKSSITGSVSSVKEKSLSEFYTDKSKTQKKETTTPKPSVSNKEYEKYLKDNLIKPLISECSDKKGKVMLEFSVDTSGNPHDIKVIKGICNAFDNEAIRLIKEGPKWIYGTQRVKIEVEF